MMLCELLEQLREISHEVGPETEVYATAEGEALAYDVTGVEIVGDGVGVKFS